MCRGEWIIFIDSDDYISEDFLEMTARSEYQDKDLILFDFDGAKEDVYTDRQSLSGVPPKDTAALRFEKDDMYRLIQRILVPKPLTEDGSADFRSPCARAYRRSVIEQYSIRFSRGITIGEDLLFNLAYQLRADSCVYIPKTVYYYDMHTGSSSRSFKPGLPENHRRLQKQVKELLEECSVFSLFENDYYSYSLENLTYVLIHGIFSPLSNKTYRENCSLCDHMRRNKIYRQAMKYSLRNGILPRKILVFFFRGRCYPAVCLICRISYRYLCRRYN